jgi:ABC-type transport system involved in multi-copper enzyme maturation permease subunit
MFFQVDRRAGRLLPRRRCVRARMVQGNAAPPAKRTLRILPMLTIALLTLRETVRRRAPIISLADSGAAARRTGVPLRGRLLLLPRRKQMPSSPASTSCSPPDIVKFFASVFAIALAAGSISAELDRGVLSSILPKPIPRLSVYAGKWLGLVAFVVLNVVVWDMVIWGVASVRAPHISHRGVFSALPYLLLYPVLFTTLALFFSAFAAFPLAAGLSILLTGVGWSETILHLLGTRLDVDLLLSLSRAAGWLMPLGRMSRWVARGMGPVLRFGGQEFAVGERGPFKDIVTTQFDLIYIGLYALAAFVAGAIILGRRDV